MIAHSSFKLLKKITKNNLHTPHSILQPSYTKSLQSLPIYTHQDRFKYYSLIWDVIPLWLCSKLMRFPCCNSTSSQFQYGKLQKLSSWKRSGPTHETLVSTWTRTIQTKLVKAKGAQEKYKLGLVKADNSFTGPQIYSRPPALKEFFFGFYRSGKKNGRENIQ